MTTRFIADLHLEESRPDITNAFLGFLPAYAHNIDALYILGDFFEAWIGDDEHTPLQETVAEALQAVTATGTALYLMHGNRDFLIGQDFCDRVGATLLDDPTVIDLHGEPTLLMHGDSLCTTDEEYQKFRATMRNPQWQKAFLQRPLADRQTVARQMREISQAKNQGKEQTIMDVTPEEVVADMERHGVQQLIHGHTHRPAVHELEANGAPARRYVTGDWHEKAWYIEARTGAAPELLSVPFAQLAG
ncbi:MULTISPECIES: UDP-2,3-diacylglucosamine diphosphatase [Halomonadaceae]|uniref:UDP-2,3-diacylglucosamine hydrolase n=1 Tax=Vreelandella halophila TaxID=86177 RepID=A0A9X5B513_9GAMM|nr:MULTISPECIES: UDP-2,3-diacylglucosamine diphosphatase [Halomonas]MYL26920.1 UDP-2,3-diacylglucosamine diphosphatase [Halomonas utahensis]MYL74181.1 UDP-2,3-diacylglucosamine diphosphatase [Halomonas sp. 22501_18_FS]